MPVERSDAARRRVSEQLAVQQHHPADEIEAQEHGHGQRHVQRDGDRLDGPAARRVDGRPAEGHVEGQGVDGANGQLGGELDDAAEAHGYAPVLYPVVNLEQLTAAKKDGLGVCFEREFKFEKAD